MEFNKQSSSAFVVLLVVSYLVLIGYIYNNKLDVVAPSNVVFVQNKFECIKDHVWSYQSPQQYPQPLMVNGYQVTCHSDEKTHQ